MLYDNGTCSECILPSTLFSRFVVCRSRESDVEYNKHPMTTLSYSTTTKLVRNLLCSEIDKPFLDKVRINGKTTLLHDNGTCSECILLSRLFFLFVVFRSREIDVE